jgi:hypothetical protein
MFAAVSVGTIVAVNGCHGRDCERSLLISTLVRALADCIMRTFFLYLGGFLLWCCQFGVVILQCMGIVRRQGSTNLQAHTLGCCND